MKKRPHQMWFAPAELELLALLLRNLADLEGDKSLGDLAARFEAGADKYERRRR